MKVAHQICILCLVIGSFAASSQECENDPNGANSCGQGQFRNETEKTCQNCPLYHYQDSNNHKCPECKPCTPCEEGFVSADKDGCPPDQDTRCVMLDIDQATDATSNIRGSTTEATADSNNLTETSSSIPGNPERPPGLNNVTVSPSSTPQNQTLKTDRVWKILFFTLLGLVILILFVAAVRKMWKMWRTRQKVPHLTQHDDVEAQKTNVFQLTERDDVEAHETTNVFQLTERDDVEAHETTNEVESSNMLGNGHVQRD